MLKIKIKKYRAKQIEFGNLWIYKSDITKVSAAASPGEICIIEDNTNSPIAIGYYNEKSEISARILTQDCSIENVDDLIISRIKNCLITRNSIKLLRSTDGVRLVNSEGDLLPGLVIDLFGKIAAVQINTAGMKFFKELIADLLLENGIDTVVIRGDSKGLIREGEEFETIIKGKNIPDTSYYMENTVKSVCMVVDGQKTGGYLDIRIPRIMLKDLSENKRVLDCFCNSGLFGLHALSGGASEVVFVESGISPIELLNKNLELNNFQDKNYTIHKINAFNYLEKAETDGEKFDIIILDPPPFAKKRKDLKRAIGAYHEIIKRGLILLNPNGIMLIATCSAHVNEEIFIKTLNRASKNQEIPVKIIYSGGQDMDHPFIPSMMETSYLKYFYVQISGEIK